jgi:hypothetical protein
MPSRRGSWPNASSIFAPIGTRRREPSVFGYGFSRPLANARLSVNAPAARSTSLQSPPNASSGRTPSDAEHRQRSERTELVLVDNASTVPLGELPASARLITLAERPSNGAARNVGLAHVSTPYVAFGDG